MATHANDSAFKVEADLHLHSTASDGSWTPEQLVDYARQIGLNAIALTDHDTTFGVAAATTHAANSNLEVIPGCELTVYNGSLELHILALFIDPTPETPLSVLLSKVRQRRVERAAEIVENLKREGVPISFEDILKFGGSADAVGLPHIARAIVETGKAYNVSNAITRYLKKGGPAYVEKYRVTPKEAIETVHASGGIAILAHPGVEPHDEQIGQLFGWGLDGLEAYYFSHSPVNRRFYARLAERFEKCVSGGSDFHAPNPRNGIVIGKAGVDLKTLNVLRKHATRYRLRAGC